MGSATEDVLEHAKLLGRGLLALAGLEGVRTKVRVIEESLRRSCFILLGYGCCHHCHLLLRQLLDLELLFNGAIGEAVSQKEGVGVVDIIRGRGGPTHCARCHSSASFVFVFCVVVLALLSCASGWSCSMRRWVYLAASLLCVLGCVSLVCFLSRGLCCLFVFSLTDVADRFLLCSSPGCRQLCCCSSRFLACLAGLS